MSSDSERSFEKCDPDFAMSERSESVSTLTSSAEDTLRIENERLRMENSLLRMEMMDRLPGSQLSNASHLQSQIGGSWKVVSSSNVDEYLSKRGASEVSDIVFQVGDVHFEFDDTHHKMRVFNQIGHKQYGEKWFEWGRPQWEGSVSFSTYFTEHCMKTVYAGRGGEEDVEEVSVSDGRLHFVIRRWGVQCERVYRRSGEGCEEKVKELEDRLEKANAENGKLKLENAELAEFKKKAEEGIKKAIVGLWKSIDDTWQWSFKVEGNKFMECRNDSKEYEVYTFGVKHSNGVTVTVEGDRIVQRKNDCRDELYMENDQLIQKRYSKDKLIFEYRYKKIGPPL